jgi:hypothetical protein
MSITPRKIPFTAQRTSLAARMGGCVPGSQPIRDANAICATDGHVLVSDVAARDVQAATSPANRIAHAGTKSWRFTGGGSGARGKADAAKAKSLDGLLSRKTALSKLPAMWPRETKARSGDIVAEYNRQRQNQSLWVLTRGTARSGSKRKTSESLAAQPTGFGCGQTRAAGADCV